ncbi:hypothetical protein THAOC_29816, partial [Thalassiosira oceanica]
MRVRDEPVLSPVPPGARLLRWEFAGPPAGRPRSRRGGQGSRGSFSGGESRSMIRIAPAPSPRRKGPRRASLAPPRDCRPTGPRRPPVTKNSRGPTWPAAGGGVHGGIWIRAVDGRSRELEIYGLVADGGGSRLVQEGIDVPSVLASVPGADDALQRQSADDRCMWDLVSAIRVGISYVGSSSSLAYDTNPRGLPPCHSSIRRKAVMPNHSSERFLRDLTRDPSGVRGHWARRGRGEAAPVELVEARPRGSHM